MPHDFSSIDRELAFGASAVSNRMDEASYRQLCSDMVAIFSQAAGRRLFWHLLLAGHYATPIFHPKNPTLTRQAVERDFVYRHLFMVLSDADPGLLASILTEGLVASAAEAKKED